ncbi:MAG: hypothetical protein LBI81_02965 [Puniceicoccales bacterium]|nr:hypothetical protein [Puniceicoccales bacterium]
MQLFDSGERDDLTFATANGAAIAGALEAAPAVVGAVDDTGTGAIAAAKVLPTPDVSLILKLDIPQKLHTSSSMDSLEFSSINANKTVFEVVENKNINDFPVVVELTLAPQIKQYLESGGLFYHDKIALDTEIKTANLQSRTVIDCDKNPKLIDSLKKCAMGKPFGVFAKFLLAWDKSNGLLIANRSQLQSLKGSIHLICGQMGCIEHDEGEYEKQAMFREIGDGFLFLK